MKKKVIIIVISIVLVLLVIFGYFIFQDLNEENKLIEEANIINELTENDINTKKLNKILSETVTSGDYATIEKAYKNYWQDIINDTTEIMNILNDEKLAFILTIDNFKEDGKNFTNTKEYINSTREKVNKLKESLTKYLTEDKIMSYVNDEDLDSYYTDFYKNELFGDFDSSEVKKTNDELEKALDEVINLLNGEEAIIDFLIANQNNWYIENDNIMFMAPNLSNQYNDLVNSLSSISDKF